MLLFGIDSLVLPCETTQTIHGSPVGINWSEKELPSHFPILDFIKGLNSLRKRNGGVLKGSKNYVSKIEWILDRISTPLTIDSPRN
jgi:hypothetical protein